MQITSKALLQIVPFPEMQKHRVTVGAAVTVVRRHFCSQMNTNNLCTEECTNCALHIQSAIYEIEQAGKPVGMFVGRTRQIVASVIEDALAEKEPSKKSVKLGDARETDAFEELLAGIT
jgi:hypothetical protein